MDRSEGEGTTDMMNDKQFFELELRMMIVPQQASWPAPEHVHWQRLHAAADEAREAVRTAYRRMDEIDGNALLSRDDKYRQRHKTAAQAIADFEASKTLARAREAVRYVMEQWKRDDVSPEIAEVRDAILKALRDAEAGWQRAIDLIDERAAQAKAPDRWRNPPWGVYSKSSLPHRR
jgi:hypothetical protein